MDEVDSEEMRTLWVGNLHEETTEAILYELFLNAGPLEHVKIPCDKDTKRQKNFAFVRFRHEASIPYAYEIMNGTALFKKEIRMQHKATGLGMARKFGGVNPPGGNTHARSLSLPGHLNQNISNFSNRNSNEGGNYSESGRELQFARDRGLRGNWENRSSDRRPHRQDREYRRANSDRSRNAEDGFDHQRDQDLRDRDYRSNNYRNRDSRNGGRHNYNDSQRNNRDRRNWN